MGPSWALLTTLAPPVLVHRSICTSRGGFASIVGFPFASSRESPRVGEGGIRMKHPPPARAVLTGDPVDAGMLV